MLRKLLFVLIRSYGEVFPSRFALRIIPLVKYINILALNA